MILFTVTCSLFEPGTGDRVDVNPPEVMITSPEQNTYVRGSFTVSGTVDDDLSIKSIEVSYQGNSNVVTKTVEHTDGDWSLNIPTGTTSDDNLAEGAQTVTVVVTDDSDKTSETFVLVIVDNVAPTVLVTVPQGYGTVEIEGDMVVLRPTITDYIDIKGEVWDPSPIMSVNISLVDVTGSTQLCSGTYTWSTRVDATSLTDLTTFSYLVEAVDKAGNASTCYYHSQDIWDLLPEDTLFPSMDEIGKCDQNHTETSSGITYGDLVDVRLGSDAALYADFYKNNDATLPEINFANLDPDNAITSNVLGTQVPINGYVNPGLPTYPVNSSSFNAWIIPAADYPTWPASPNIVSDDITTTLIGTTSISFQIDPKLNSSYLDSGQYWVKVEVGVHGSDAVSSLTCGFLVDTGAPRIESAIPENNSLVTRKVFEAGTPLEGDTGVEILVQAIDDNTIQSFTATASLTEGGPALGGLASAVDTGDWYIVQVPLGAGNDNIWFEIEVADDTNSIAHESLHYTIDETIPAITIDSPAPGAWVTGNSTTISGTSSDNTGQVETIYVWLGLVTDTPPVDITTWDSLAGNAAWVTTLPLLGTEGEYTINAVAVDFAGNQSVTASVNFYLDYSSPTLTETSIGETTAYENALFTLSGTASDTNAVAHITVSEILNGGAPSLVLDQDITGLNYNWSYTLPGGASEGTYEYTITLTDAAGKSASPINRTVIYDETAPLVDIIAIAPIVGINSVNGIISYSAYAADVNGITAVRRWVLLFSDPAPDWDTAGYAVWASPYSATLDTTVGLTDGQDYIIYVKAIDTAGNVNSVSRTININQSSDMPALILSNLDETKNTPALGWDNLLESNAKIEGSITDDDMVDASSIEISIDSVSAWTAVTQKGPNGKSVSFEHDLTTPVELPEGSHYFYVRSSDLASEKSGLAAVNVTLGPVYFVIDKNPPSIAITLPAQDTVQSGDFTISGTASDANGLVDLDIDTFSDIEVSTDGGTNWSVLSADGGTWTYDVTIDTIGHTGDGVHTYKFRATDYFGKTQTLDLRFTVDTSGPTITMIAPAAASWLSGSTYLASGTSSDGTGTGVEQVYWWASAQADTPPGDIGSWNVASGTTFWSGLMDLAALGEGDKRFHVQAEDKGGIFSSIITRDFGIDQADPVLDITNIAAGVEGRNAVFNMTGTADDSNDLASILVEQRKDADPFVTIENFALTGISDTFDITGLPRDPATPGTTLFADGLFEYRVTITDAAGRVNQASRTIRIDQTPPVVVIINPGPSAWLSGSAFNASGTATDALTGVTLVEYSTDNTNWFNATGTVSWNTTLDLVAIGEGALTFYVRATDDAGNTSTPETQSFGIDQNIPDLAETNINQTSAYKNADYTLSGTASDTNKLLDNAGVDYITLSINGGASQNIDVVAGSWSYDVTVDTVGHTDDGEYEYIFTATDIAGKYRQVTRIITIDTSLPTAEITGITPVVGSNTVNGIISYGAYASDESGVTGVKCWMLLATDPDPDYSTVGEIASWAAPPYSGTIDTESLTDLTDYKLWIGVQDKAGNEIAVSQTIAVDQSSDDPACDITNMDETKDTAPEAGDNLQESNAKVQGIISDDDIVDGTTIQISIDGSAYGPVSQSGPNGKTVTFEHDVSGLSEGIHYYSVQADDLASAKAGKPAVTGTLGPVYFTIDRNPPQIATTNPSQDSLLNANFSITGTASDANGLADLDIDTLADIEVSTDGGNNWSIISADGGTWSYDVTVDTVGHTDDGSYTYKLRATDSFNKTTIIDYRFVIDTEAALATVSAPAPSSWVSTTPFAVTGTAGDNSGGSGVAEIWTLVDNAASDHSSDTFVQVTTGGLWQLATGTSSWNEIWDLGTEGNKKLWVALLDNAGNWTTTYQSISFGYDSANPALDETAFGTSGTVYDNTTLDFSGTATDSNPDGSPTLEVNVDGGLGEAITITAGSWTYSYPVNAGTHAQDGSHNFVFTLTDASGKTSTDNRNIIVDTITPSVQINSVMPILPGNQVNGVVTLSSNISDDNGINGVKYFIRNDASTPIYTDGDGTVIPSAPYSANIDTTSYTDDTWTLWVMAIDKADNTQSTSAVIDILQSTDNPGAVIDTPADTDPIGADKKVRGTYSDDDGVATTGATLYVRKQGEPSYTNKAINTASGANQLIAWTVDVTDVITAGGDGTYEMYLSVTDDATQKSGKPAESTDTTVQTFTSDTNPPTVSTISIVPSQAAYKALDVLTLSWNAIDLLGLAAQNVDVDGSGTGLGSITNLGGGDYEITYTVPDSGITSGNKTFTLIAEDNTGHTTTKTVTFLVDIDDPVVDNAYTINPSFIGFTPNGQFEIKGTASDNRGLSSVELQLSGPDGNDGTNWYAAAVTSGNWTYNVADSSTYVITSGTLNIKVRATDQAGNISTERDFNQAVDQSADKAIATLISPVDSSTYGTTVQISGTAADDDDLADIDDNLVIDTDAIEIFWDTVPTSGGTTVNPAITGTGKNATYNHTLNGLSGGDYVVRVRAKDDASTWGDWSGDVTFTVNAGAPNLTITTTLDAFRNNPSLLLEGSVEDSDGVVDVRVRVNGGGWQTANANSGSWGPSNTSDTWDITLNLGSDGLKTLEIQAQDNSSYVANEQLSTTLDSTSPAGTFDVQFRDDPSGSFLDTDALNKVIRITGTVTELNLADTNPVEISIDGGAYVPVTGTFVWSYVWDTSGLADGDYDLQLRITDKAGNVTDTITKTVTTDQGADIPGITSNFVAAPDSAQAGNNVLGTLLKVSGTITDDDGFNSGAVEIFLDGSPTSIAASNTSGTTGTWEYTWASLAQGEHYLTFRTTDKNGAVYNATITYFLVDTENPALGLTTPTAGEKVNAGTLSIIGTASDAGSLDANSLSIDLRHSNVSSSLHGVNYTPAVGGGTWNQDVTIDSAVLDGTLYIDLTLTDRAGKESTMTRAVTIDITDPVLNLNYPAPEAYINGLVYVTGTADDLNGLSDVTLEILDPSTRNPVSSITRSSATLAAWEFPFNSFSYTSATYGVDVYADGTLWQVFFRLAAHDNSGNITELKVGDPLDWPYFYIDTDGDKPTISVTQPKHGDNIGGIVGMFGTATDDDGPVMQVEIRIDFTGDGDFAGTRDINNNDMDGNPATGIELGLDTDILGTMVRIGDADYKWEDESAWYVIDVSNNAWTQELNSNGELYQSNTGGNGDIVIQVRSRDMFGLASEISERTITLDETFPRIENALPVDQTYQNDTFNLTVEFADNIDLDLGSNSQIRININKTGYDTLSEGTYVAGTHPYDLIADLAEPQNGFDLDYPINTNTYFPGSSGILYVDLYVRDESSYVNQRSLTFYVDNQPPTSSWSTSITRPDGSNLRNGMITVNAVDKTYMEGNYSDSGSVSGISHIEVYFVKSGVVRNLKSTGTWGGTPATESISVENYNLGTNTWSSSIDPAAPYVDHTSLGNDYVIKIDVPTEMSDLNFGADTDGDGYHEFLGIYDGAPRWRAYFDSQYIPDGIIDLHYIAYDLAGNREHKMRQVFIANNGPRIDQIQIGSDLNFSGDVVDVGGGVTEIQDYYYPGGAVDRIDYQQIKNNKLYFGIYGDDPTGTNQGVKQIFVDVYDSTGLTYHGQAHASGLNPAGGDEIITLDVNPGTAPWVDDGNYTVSPYKVNYQVKITVRDNDDINMTHWVKVSVLNPNDTTPPVITLDPLAQADQDGSTGHLELQGDNTAGDWDTLTAGYTPDDDDPKASGVIIFKGTVTDENRLTEISVASENNPMPVLASWVGGVLVSNDVSIFTIDSQELVETGHTVTFTYKWDSSDVTGIAGMDRTVTFDAEDGAATPNSAVDQSQQLDVVPYIDTITRQAPLPTNRTKYGKFLVSSGETNIMVTGFNLGDGTYTPAVTINRTGGGIQNTIAATGSGTPYNSLTITGAQMVNSGWIEIAVNGQPSINNLNANTLDSNKEDDGSGISSTFWNDDRYMLVFDIGDYFAGSDAPEWPSMSVNFTTGNIYGSWSSYNTAQAYYARPNSHSTTRTDISDNPYDPAEYTDIMMYDDATDVRHTVVLENENGAGAWRGLRSKINDGSGIYFDYLGGDDDWDTNTNTIDHSDGKDEMLFQFKNPRIAVNPAGAGTNNDVKYVSYYDSWSKCLKYGVITGATGTFISHWAHLTDNEVVVDGMDWINSAPDYKYASSEDVGLWNDIGIDPDDGVPVIVYYSVTNKTLKIARGWDTQPVGDFNGTAPYAPSGAHEWNIANVRPSNSYLGSYVSMTIDSNPASTTYGDIFIVTFQNATGDLVYIHGHDVDGTGAGLYYTFDDPVTIDTEGSVGAWGDIALMYNGTTAVPYVSYLNSSAVGTLEGLKYAWIESGDGSSSDDWEYGIIPSDDPVRSHRTNIVAHSSVNIGRNGGENADVAIGFAGTYFDIVYRAKEQ